jgi:ribokinase
MRGTMPDGSCGVLAPAVYSSTMPHVPRIAVVGSAVVDLTVFTDHFPRPGETIFGEHFDLGFGGKGANQAVAARLCGADVTMVARVGDDLFGPATRANFDALGIDARHVQVTAGCSTGVAPILVDSAGQNRIIVVKGANGRLAPADVDAAEAVIARAGVLILQLEVPLETVYHAAALACARGIRCILNPAPGQPLDMARLSHLDYLVPNETEAEMIAGTPVHTVDDAARCAARIRESGIRRVIVTLGSRGAMLSGPEGTVHVPAVEVETVDSTGAGDAFIGSFATFLAEGIDEVGAIRRANLYAALSTAKVGTQKSFADRAAFERAWHAR